MWIYISEIDIISTDEDQGLRIESFAFYKRYQGRFTPYIKIRQGYKYVLKNYIMSDIEAMYRKMDNKFIVKGIEIAELKELNRHMRANLLDKNHGYP